MLPSRNGNLRDYQTRNLQPPQTLQLHRLQLCPEQTLADHRV
jgi:hypothetical protein